MPTSPDGATRPGLLRRGGTVLATVAATGVLLVAGTGYGLLAWSDASITRVDAFAGIDGPRPPASRAGVTTFLLVGSDARTGMSAHDMKRLHVGTAKTTEGRRADTMLLVQVSERYGVTAVSLPRDSYVSIPAHTGTDGQQVRERRNKLNAAYAVGGPRLAIETVERSTGVRVDHYVEVDFLGFVGLVDAVGGVDVCAPRPLRDQKAGLRLPAGVSHVDGRTGLAYVRARSLDGRADLGRIDRQQRFLGAMAHRVTSKEVLLDPRAMIGFLDAALAAVRVDPGLERDDLVTLAARLRHVAGADVRFLTVPVANPSYRPGGVGAVALWDDRAAKDLFASLREDRPPAAAPARKRPSAVTVAPRDVRVQVFNGTTVAGLGSKASTQLASRGFAVAAPARNWTSSDVAQTVIRYDARYTESVKTLAAAVPGARLEGVTGLGRTLQVVVGSSYAGTHAVRPSSASATPGARPVARTAADKVCD